MKDKCIITTVRDEGAILPQWFNYYLKFFAPEDFYILDDGSTDGSLDALDPNMHVEKLTGIGQNAGANSLAPVVGQKIKSLLQFYKCVTFVEADDFLIVDPSIYPHGMPQMYEKFLATPQEQIVTFEGWGLIQELNSEPAIELDKPWLGQRKNWIRIPKWDNTLIFKTPPQFYRGYHYIKNTYVKAPVTEGCVLIDTHYMDLDICQARHKQRTRTYTNQNAYHAETGEALKMQFYERLNNPRKFHNDAQTLTIGERFKTIL
jgi:hypothetical protein